MRALFAELGWLALAIGILIVIALVNSFFWNVKGDRALEDAVGGLVILLTADRLKNKARASGG